VGQAIHFFKEVAVAFRVAQKELLVVVYPFTPWRGIGSLLVSLMRII
jgi:hypothetical protein